MTDDIDPTTLPDDTRDGEVEPGGEGIEGADEAEDGGDAADKAIDEEAEDED